MYDPPPLVTKSYIVTMIIARKIVLASTLLRTYLLPSLHSSGNSGINQALAPLLYQFFSVGKV